MKLETAEAKSLPMVSVITATYNAAKTLRACMDSVRMQNYPNLEHILVDGASQDNTLEVIQQHAAAKVRWVSEPDRGIYDAWNKGLAMAKGEWIAFLGADDIYLPGAIESFMQLAKEHPEAMYLSGQVRWIGPAGKSRVIGEPWQWPRFQRFMCTAHVGSFHRRSLFDTYGIFDDSYRMTADYELLLRARGNLRSAFLTRVVAEMQCGGATDSIEALDEARRAKVKSGGRSLLAATLDRWLARIKFGVRYVLQHISAKLHHTFGSKHMDDPLV